MITESVLTKSGLKYYDSELKTWVEQDSQINEKIAVLEKSKISSEEDLELGEIDEDVPEIPVLVQNAINQVKYDLIEIISELYNRVKELELHSSANQ